MKRLADEQREYLKIILDILLQYKTATNANMGANQAIYIHGAGEYTINGLINMIDHVLRGDRYSDINRDIINSLGNMYFIKNGLIKMGYTV